MQNFRPNVGADYAVTWQAFTASCKGVVSTGGGRGAKFGFMIVGASFIIILLYPRQAAEQRQNLE